MIKKKIKYFWLIILPSALLCSGFSLTGGGLGDADLHKELAQKTKEKKWEIVVGGNRIYQIDIKRRKREPIMSMAEQNKYIWSMASLSPDGQWLALLRSPRRPPFKGDLILIDWKEFIRSSKAFNELVQIPLPDLDIEGFAWAPDRHSLALKVHKEEHQQDQNRVYEFTLETRHLRELPIAQIFALYPNAWSKKGYLAYKSEDNTLEKTNPENRNKYLPDINRLALFNFNSNKTENSLSGDFPTWNQEGVLTFLDITDNNYYTHNFETGKREILLKNQEIGSGNGVIYGPIIWSPNDQYILYGRSSGFTGSFDDLYAMEVATGRETLICRGVDMLFAGHASWVALAQSPKNLPSEQLQN